MSYNDGDTFLPHTGPPVIGALPLAALRPVIHQLQLSCKSLEPMAPAGIVGGRNGSGSVVAVVMIIEDEDQVRVLVESVLQDHGHYSPSPTLQMNC